MTTFINVAFCQTVFWLAGGIWNQNGADTFSPFGVWMLKSSVDGVFCCIVEGFCPFLYT